MIKESDGDIQLNLCTTTSMKSSFGKNMCFAINLHVHHRCTTSASEIHAHIAYINTL